MTTLAAIAGRVSKNSSGIDWRAVGLILLMALPFALGFALRWATRGLARTVWAIGWAAGWAYYTAAEGWAAAGGKT